jgi:hypothetical protein
MLTKEKDRPEVIVPGYDKDKDRPEVIVPGYDKDRPKRQTKDRPKG